MAEIKESSYKCTFTNLKRALKKGCPGGSNRKGPGRYNSVGQVEIKIKNPLLMN